MPAIERDTGLGTTYERIAVARLIEELAGRYAISSVLEGPVDGITGIRGLNSVPFAQRGARVEVVLADREEVEFARRIWAGLGLAPGVATIREGRDWLLGGPDAGFDLVWNFNALPQAPDPERLLDEMCRASARYVLVFVSNTLNYGFPIHRLHHRRIREPWSHGRVSVMNTRHVERSLGRRGFGTVRRLLVDVPWWPDIDSPIEEVAAAFLPFLKGRVEGSKRLERYTWNASSLPYFDPERRRRLEADLERHFLIERARWCPMRALFAHHRGILAERGTR
jgi:SAM-dependent methyltransferase